MPTIKSSTDLRNNYNEISEFCKQNREPVFITRNGRGDLAVMSIETYELLAGRLELHGLLAEGRHSINEGRKRPLVDALRGIRQGLEDG
ncbi:MAG: type II toxin-antitoxin system Phd/YefM family antitoxin [Limnochordia bacterium]|nr:type II toxin-antitoxin system Phd/YefM family antitoxin [Limnochordia bacterium]